MRKPTKTTTWERTPTWPKGLLRHVGTGRFYGRFSLGGKTKFVPLDTTLLDIARLRFADHRARVERNRKAAKATKSGNASMGDLLLLYRESVKTRTGIKDKTKEGHLGITHYIEKTWPGFAGLRPDEIKPSAVIEWRDRALSDGTGYKPPGAKAVSANTAGKSASMFNKAVDALRRMLNMAVDGGAIHANPLTDRRGLKAKDAPRKPRLPEAKKLHEVFAEIERIGGRGVEAANFCRFLAFTGCRKSEAAAIRWLDVDTVRGIIRVNGTKTDASVREVPLSKSARQLLDRILARRQNTAKEIIDGDPQIDPHSPVLAVQEAQKSLDRACAKVGAPRLTHHDLRDAFATNCIEAGVDIPTVAAWLGHADGGALLMRVYAHHRRAHSLSQIKKVKF